MKVKIDPNSTAEFDKVNNYLVNLIKLLYSNPNKD